MVEWELKKLIRKTVKIYELKDNIRMRVLSLGWTDLVIAWSRNGIPLIVSVLTSHPKSIIVQQKKKTS